VASFAEGIDRNSDAFISFWVPLAFRDLKVNG